MADLLRPGAGRADGVMDDAALLAAMLRVERAWLAALADAGIAPSGAVAELDGLVGVDEVAADGEAAGNPVVPLVRLLRERLEGSGSGDGQTARWLHRGLTSQDVLDTALVLGVRDGLDLVLVDVGRQLRALLRLLDEHGTALLTGRTLARPAVPITFGYKIASWAEGILDAAVELRGLRGALPVQQGGAAGTRAASAELAHLAGLADPVRVARDLAGALASGLGLAPALPWHTNRRPITRIGDALVAVTDAFGRIANDVVTMSRPEIGELGEGAGGGSSTMPGKHNPVLATLVRAAAQAAPLHAVTLHLAAAGATDERPAGSWHAEWPALRDVTRAAVVAAGQMSDLLTGLRVDPRRMAANAEAAATALMAERHGLHEALGGPARTAGPGDYLGTVQESVAALRRRAGEFLEGAR